MPFKIVILFSLLGLFVSCNQPLGNLKKSVNFTPENLIIDAKRFAIVKTPEYRRLYIFGNRNNFDTTSRFVLADDTNNLARKFRNAVIVKTPVKSVAALGSIYANMLDTLGALDNLSAIDDIDYLSNKNILEKFGKKNLVELAKSPQIDIEKTYNLHPDLIITYGMGNDENDIDKKLELLKAPVAVVVDHLEESPLARAEWIKFIAAFVNKDAEADSIFNTTKRNYNELKQLGLMANVKPTVFTEIKYGDVWHMPGGKSFMATLIKDAGGDYLWADNEQAGSIPLGFEQVLAKAKDADFWLNLSGCKTKNELKQFESRYDVFKAFKTGNLFNNTKHLNPKGYSNYWETGMIYPDRILSDLIQIIHPEIKFKTKPSLYYYKKLN